MLVVDRCVRASNHLDISTAAGNEVVGGDTGFYNTVSYTEVPQFQCADIWTGNLHPYAGPGAVNAPGILSFQAMKKGIVQQIPDGQVQVSASIPTPTSKDHQQCETMRGRTQPSHIWNTTDLQTAIIQASGTAYPSGARKYKPLQVLVNAAPSAHDICLDVISTVFVTISLLALI
jgi:hypothetical protein